MGTLLLYGSADPEIPFLKEKKKREDTIKKLVYVLTVRDEVLTKQCFSFSEIVCDPRCY